jgi:membrane fusion protein (multidrug efflux system)
MQPIENASNNRVWRHFSLIGSVAVVIALASMLAACTSQAQQAATPPPPTVEVIEVSARDTDIYSEYPAQTYARNLVEVRGRVDGYIERWLFRPGQQVTAGQPLYILDLRPFRAQVDQSEGALRQAEAELDFAQQQTSVRQAEANLAAAKANLVKAQQDYERFKPLVEQDAAAKQDLDAAIASLGAAESSVRASEAALEQARVNTKTSIQNAEGRVQAQRGALRTASLNLQYGTIAAPIAGIAGDTLVPVGGLVTANSPQPLTTIVPLDPIWVRFKVSESQYLQFQRLRDQTGDGAALELLLADNSRFPQAGRIENTLNQVDSRTGTLEMQARFPNPDKTVLPGQFGRVRFVTAHRANAILVPQRAVQQSQSLQSVYVVGPGNKIEARPVKTAQRVGEDWIIEQGLEPGERVVVEGLLTVRPGVVVRPVAYRKAAAPETASVHK